MRVRKEKIFSLSTRRETKITCIDKKITPKNLVINIGILSLCFNTFEKLLSEIQKVKASRLKENTLCSKNIFKSTHSSRKTKL